MSKLPKTMELDEMGIKRLSAKEDIKGWLWRLIGKLEEIYRLIREHTESGGMKTKTWRIAEKDNGDLELQHLESGQWVRRGFKYKGS